MGFLGAMQQIVCANGLRCCFDPFSSVQSEKEESSRKSESICCFFFSSITDTLNLWREEGRRWQMEKTASQGWLQPERGLKRHPWVPYFFCHQWLPNQMSPICRSKWDFSYWLPWKLSRLSTNRVMCILNHHQPLPIAGMSELGRCWQICHWCMRPGKIQLLLAWQCWPGLSINEEQMQFAKHIELIRGYNKAGLESLF